MNAPPTLCPDPRVRRQKAGTRLATLAIAALAIALATLGACKSPNSSPSTRHPAATHTVVATTTMLADLVHQIGGESMDARSIMAPGGDPHLYQPTPRDARLIASSDMVVTSGLTLEGWIDDLVRNAGGSRPVVVASRHVEPRRMAGRESAVDPHFWFDLEAWGQAAQEVGSQLELLFEAPDIPALRERVAAYQALLQELDAWTRRQLETVPREQRVLVTSHDAFGYFGRAFDLEVVAIQGMSTEQEASQRDVANVIEIVRQRNAPAIFMETSVNAGLIEQVARETGVQVAGPLYSDSIGPADSAANTFVRMFQANVSMIVQALGGQVEPFDASPQGVSP